VELLVFFPNLAPGQRPFHPRKRAAGGGFVVENKCGFECDSSGSSGLVFENIQHQVRVETGLCAPGQPLGECLHDIVKNQVVGQPGVQPQTRTTAVTELVPPALKAGLNAPEDSPIAVSHESQGVGFGPRREAVDGGVAGFGPRREAVDGGVAGFGPRRKAVDGGVAGYDNDGIPAALDGRRPPKLVNTRLRVGDTVRPEF
jgi:hypothetical protein